MKKNTDKDGYYTHKEGDFTFRVKKIPEFDEVKNKAFNDKMFNELILFGRVITKTTSDGIEIVGEEDVPKDILDKLK